MPKLTVHLWRITNLIDDAQRDVADPYVRFDLEQNNRGIRNDQDYGQHVSSKKTNETNPVYSEDFTFEDLPSLDNMELKITVLDDDTRDADDKLGGCKIKLEKLDLSSEPLEVRRKINNRIARADSWIFLRLTWGEPAVDEDAAALSHVGAAAYEALRTKHHEHHHQLWNVTSGAIVGDLHQTPKEAWPGHPVHPDGHDDWFPEIMGEILSRTTNFADVLSLGPPDGKFMTAFQGALAKIAETAEGKKHPIVVRMMFGNIIGMPTDCDGVLAELTKDLPADANIRLWVGAWRKGVSWNHAKIIAVDGKYLHTGGHNMWDAHYLEYDPVHDLSLEMAGVVAQDGHTFANRQWDFVESRQESFWGSIGDKMPDHMPQANKVRVTVSHWPEDKAKEYPPDYRKKRTQHLAEPIDDAVPIITMGRYGTLTTDPPLRPADDAFLAMFDAAQTIIRLCLQDLGPVCLPGTKIALPGCTWPDGYLTALARAIWERGVDVEIAVSNPGSIPAGLSPTEACYGNGWDCNDVAAEIIKRIKRDFPDASDEDLRQKVADNLRVCFIREERGNAWEDEMTMGNHSKHFIVDDIATYIGSQNLYVCDLAEWGVVIDDAGATQKMMEEYWIPMWKWSFEEAPKDVDVHQVMDSLGIDRDGADPSDLDDETRAQMKQAELANAGHGKSGLYADEE